jgi:hypothetical protein
MEMDNMTREAERKRERERRRERFFKVFLHTPQVQDDVRAGQRRMRELGEWRGR